MVTIERKLGGILSYRSIFFPTADTLGELTCRMPPAAIARLFFTVPRPQPGRCVISARPSFTVCIDLTRSPEALLQDVRKTARYEIRQVEKMGDRVETALAKPDLSEEFLTVYREFARTKRVGVAPLSRTMLRRYKNHADIFMSYLDGQAMCGHVMLRDSQLGRARLLYSASRRLENQDMARLCGAINRHLHWQEMRFYQDHGFKVYDWGGIVDDPNDGIARFKRSFGGELVTEQTLLCAGSAWLGRIAQHMRSTIATRRATIATWRDRNCRPAAARIHSIATQAERPSAPD